jgi:hypothetical protein
MPIHHCRKSACLAACLAIVVLGREDAARAAAQVEPVQAAPAGAQAPPPAPPAETSPADPGRRDFMFKGALRIGSEVPLGNMFDSPTGGFGDNVSNQTVVTFDVGLRYRAWVFGLYLGLGGGSAKGAGVTALEQQGFSSPSTFILQLGPEVHYNVYDRGPLRPWVGVGLGLDALLVGADMGGIRYHEDYSAFTPFRPMVGVDWLITRGIGLGLYADWQIAQYGSASVSVTDANGHDLTPTTNVQISNPAFHQWFGLGARAILFP